MTLIAAYRAKLGIALCADSQETVTQFDENGTQYEVRVTVQKIEPITFGKYQIAVSGAGNASLIEGFIERAKRALRDQDAVICTQECPASVLSIHDRLESELSRFYANDVATCPDADKNFKLFIAGCCPIAQQYSFWISENTVLRELRSNRPELIGWEHGLYSETATRLFSQDMTIAQAALASLYTLTIAKDTSNYVRDPFSLAIVTKDGIRIEDADYIKSMEDRLGDYEAALNRIFLSCSDTTISVPELEDQIAAFKEAALNLHKEHIDQQAGSMSLEDMLKGEQPRKLPKGPVYFSGDGKLRVEHDREKIADSRKKFEWTRILSGAGPIIATVRCKCGRTFEREFPTHKVAYGSVVKCDCGESEILREIDARLKDPKQLGADR